MIFQAATQIPYYALTGLYKINFIYTGLTPCADILRRFQGLIQNSQPAFAQWLLLYSPSLFFKERGVSVGRG
jgi:hypothetical protein